ncbi:MAG: PTS sugar transporter subunit IIA [bacterium]
MTLQEVANLFGLPDRVIRRWVRQGTIPCRTAGTQPVFDEQELREWAKAHNLALTSRPNAAPSQRKVHVSLSQAMRQGGVFSGIPGKDVPGVLEALVEIAPLPESVSRSLLLSRLLEREKLASTGLGHGVAVPHPRTPLEDAAPDPLVVTGFLKDPIDYGSIDGLPVFVLCMILSPTSKVHLHLLSRLGFCLRNEEFIAFLQTQPSAEELLVRVRQVEEALDGGKRT